MIGGTARRCAVDPLQTVCAAQGFQLEKDLTDKTSGYGQPVGRVQTSNGPAILRLGVEIETAAMYRLFSDTGVTPALLDIGEEAGNMWMLVEWIEGDVLDPFHPDRRRLALTPNIADLALTPNIADLALTPNIADLVHEVAAMARQLHFHPAPPLPADLLAVRVADFEDFERQLAAATKLSGSVVPVSHIGTTLSEPAVFLHGDLVIPNVLRTPAGELRCIDLSSMPRIGPAETDLASWLSNVLSMLSFGTPLDQLTDLAADLVDGALASAEWLDEERLHAWMGFELARAALVNAQHGVYLATCQAMARLGSYVYARGARTRQGRNEACACGSGRKYKHCCGR